MVASQFYAEFMHNHGYKIHEVISLKCRTCVGARFYEVSSVINARLAGAHEGESAHSNVRLTELGSR